MTPISEVREQSHVSSARLPTEPAASIPFVAHIPEQPPSLFSRVRSSFTPISSTFRVMSAFSRVILGPSKEEILALHNKNLPQRLEKSEELKAFYEVHDALFSKKRELKESQKTYDLLEISLPFDPLAGLLSEIKDLEFRSFEKLKALYETKKLVKIEIDFYKASLRKSYVTEKNHHILTAEEVEKAFEEQGKVLKKVLYPPSPSSDHGCYICPFRPLAQSDSWANKGNDEQLFHFKSSSTEVCSCKTGIAEAIGRRKTMEDAHLAREIQVLGESYPLFGVFDGHGGPKASQYVHDYLAVQLQKWLELFCNESQSTALTDEVIYNAFNSTLVELSEQFPCYKNGTTVNMCLIANRHIYTANIGDSRSVLVDCSGRQGIQLSEDAKPDSPRHRKIIEDLGGLVVDGCIRGETVMLAMGSSLGDHYCKGSNPTVDITKEALPDHESKLVIACDGIWDVISSTQATHFILSKPSQSMQELANDLIYSAWIKKSQDNLSALVVKISPKSSATA